MRDLSMHVLDIVMNSIKAQATNIDINIYEKNETLELKIKDNGCGMSKEQLDKVMDPFYTTRTTRKVGLGIPLLYDNVKRTEGIFNITSGLKKGTVIEAIFNKKHIDCIPFGKMNETILSLIMMEPEIDYLYSHIKEEHKYILDTKEIKTVLEDVPITNRKVIAWLKEDLNDYDNFREVSYGKIRIDSREVF